MTLLLLAVVGGPFGFVGRALATDISIAGQFNFTDNRNPNPAGAVPGYLIAVGATNITPSGVGTTTQAVQGATTLGVPFIPSTVFPDNYFATTFNLALTGPWTLTATDAAGPVSVLTNSIPTPEVIPLVNNLQASGSLLTPHVSWTLPDFTGLGVTRILVRVRDLDHFINGASDIIFSSASLAATATFFDIPSNVLTPGKHYSFDVLVDNLVTPSSGLTFLQNRSETFTGVYTTPEASTLLLLGAGLAGLGALVRRREPRGPCRKSRLTLQPDNSVTNVDVTSARQSRRNSRQSKGKFHGSILARMVPRRRSGPCAGRGELLLVGRRKGRSMSKSMRRGVVLTVLTLAAVPMALPAAAGPYGTVAVHQASGTPSPPIAPTR